nr:hypothetical protein GCM10020063_031990 [Dactylosporangium thailandense]
MIEEGEVGSVMGRTPARSPNRVEPSNPSAALSPEVSGDVPADQHVEDSGVVLAAPGVDVQRDQDQHDHREAEYDPDEYGISPHAATVPVQAPAGRRTHE